MIFPDNTFCVPEDGFRRGCSLLRKLIPEELAGVGSEPPDMGSRGEAERSGVYSCLVSKAVRGEERSVYLSRKIREALPEMAA